jgi:hypothetical protein
MQISKALLVRSHPDATLFVDRLFELLEDQNVGWDAARAIGDISGPDNVLTKRNNANIRACIFCETHWPEKSDLFCRSFTHKNISTTRCHV